MKFEIDVPDDYINTAIKEQIKKQVLSYISDYRMQKNIDETISQIYRTAIDHIILEEMKNTDKLKEKIREMMTNKIKARLNKLMQEEK